MLRKLMKKRNLFIAVVLLMTLSSSGMVFANSENPNELGSITAIYDMNEDKNNTSSEIQPYSYLELSRTLVETTTIEKHPIGWARNQPEGGVVFSNTGSISYSDGGGNISISLGASYGYASASISIGKVSSGVTSYSVTGLEPGVPWKLFIYKDLEVKEYLVEYNWYGARGTKTEYVTTPTGKIYLEAQIVE